MPEVDRRREALEDYLAAQRLAFAPLMFQAARVARDNGTLEALEAAGAAGTTADEVRARTQQSLYATRVLLEACAATELASFVQGRYGITRLGRVVLRDSMTRVNMDFTHDVCFRGAFYLDQALSKGMPAGLQVFGDWPTVYEGLSQLPEPVKKSWFAFDHFYSDVVFPLALPLLFAQQPKTVLDVGGNTGKFARACVAHDADVTVTMLDHPQQLAVARAENERAGTGERIRGQGMNLLDASQPFPAPFDAVWMSQFLDCFSEDEIVHLLERGRQALSPSGRLFIVETYWDRQPNAVARFCVQATSLYFACMANGNSRMYASGDLLACVQRAGLRVEVEHQLGYHTLWVCAPA